MVLLPLHIIGGLLGVRFAYVALSARKGSRLHLRSGMLFVYAMLVMGVTASVLEFLQSADATNVVAALMSLYFVGTALTTVRPPSPWTRAINVAALTVAAGLAFIAIAGGVKAVNTPGLSSRRSRAMIRPIGTTVFGSS